MRFSVVAGLVAPCCLVAACGSSGPSAGSLSGESPLEILALTTTAITANGFSFHFIDVSDVGAKTTTLTGTDTAAGSEQTLSGAVPALTVERRSDGTVFVREQPRRCRALWGCRQRPPPVMPENGSNCSRVTPRTAQ